MRAQLIAARVNAGMSINQAAKAIGVHRLTLAKAEAGKRVHESCEKRIAEFWGFEPIDVWPVSDEEEVAA